MQNHFLVTISNDANILYGVKFICSFFRQNSTPQITLLHICKRDGKNVAGTVSNMWQGPGDDVQSQLTVQARKSINKAKELLSHHKIAFDQVMTKTYIERYGKVQDILNEGGKGCYDAIILGRRASYSLQWMFERPADETARAIVKASGCTTPLWFCPEPLPDRKNLLLCVDGSDSSFRAVDHVGFILATQNHQHITLFHVETGDNKKAPDIFSKAEAILHGHGVGSERISRKTAQGLTVAGPILSEIKKGGFAAVAIGLHGEKQEVEGKLYLGGSTTVKLISRIELAALWCCP